MLSKVCDKKLLGITKTIQQWVKWAIKCFLSFASIFCTQIRFYSMHNMRPDHGQLYGARL